ncbi:MAG: hypothetical protein AAF587_09690 [Bacteroidota bacterium]
MKHLFYWAILALLCGCSDSGISGLEVADKGDIPPTFSYRGEFVEGRSWVDQQGQNLLLLTRSEFSHQDTALSVALFAYHLVVEQDTGRLLRMDRVTERKCKLKNRASFSPDIFLTDVDKNGMGEVVFAFLRGCSTQEEPLTIRMVMFEDGEIFVIRGSTRLATGEGGKKRVEYSFFFGPPEFLRYANQVWRAYVRPKDVST